MRDQTLISDPQTQDFDSLKVTSVLGSKKGAVSNYEVHSSISAGEVQTGATLRGFPLV